MSHTPSRRTTAIAAALTASLAAPAFAQDEGGEESRRTRIGVGAHLYPSYPGSDSFDIGPILDLDRARGAEPFEFEAPDDSFSLALIDSGGFELGPVVNFEGARSAEDVGALLPKVKFSLEPGAFAALKLGESFRLRAEVRKGVTGHKGWIGLAGADWIARDGDAWLFSIGPRVTWSDDRYHDAWWGVAPTDAAPSGLPAYDPDGGIHAVGGAASFETQLGPRWGIATYAKYDRLVGDAADSPIVRQLGSRDQFSGGLALTYTFDGDIFD
jgi:outer membrane scaffolding protein for murein synthesis (MipA/OmpV family)